MRIRMLALSAFVFFSSSYPNALCAEVFERYVTFTLDDSQITEIQSGGLDVFELSTGFSETFEPAQLQGVDMINVYADFVDQQGNKLYVVLKDLGGQYLYPNGWQWFQVSLGLDMGTVSGTYVNGWVFTESVPDRPAISRVAQKPLYRSLLLSQRAMDSMLRTRRLPLGKCGFNSTSIIIRTL